MSGKRSLLNHLAGLLVGILMQYEDNRSHAAGFYLTHTHSKHTQGSLEVRVVPAADTMFR
jgi:hypothetical protein